MGDPDNNVHNFKVGRFNCAVIDDGFTEYATADMLFNRAPEKELEGKLHSYRLNPDRIKCFNNCLLIKNDSDFILIDTGFGHVSVEYPGAENAGMLIENMKKSGFHPEDVSKIILTHYHTDHIGGCLDHKGEPAFPNATFYMNSKDWQKGTLIESFGKNILLTLENRMRFFDGEIDLFPGIKALPAPGHTPGHTIVRVESAGKELLYISDLAAHQIHFECPEWSMAHEFDPDLAAGIRREIFGNAADNNILLLAYHLPFPGLGYLREKNEGWSWQSLEK